jgi:thiamine biosynthesis lipoprotein
VRGRRLALLLVLAWALAACGRAPLHQQEAFRFRYPCRGVDCRPSEAEARPAAAAVLREFDRLHRLPRLAAFRAERLNRNSRPAGGTGDAGNGRPDQPTRSVFRCSAKGFSTPGSVALIALWGFQSDELPASLPDAGALAAWRAAPRASPTCGSTAAGQQSQAALALDFGGYLKGVALDRAASILKAQGVHNALINIGGNVMALGSKNGQRWRVGIQHPRQPGPLATVELDDGEAIGTSGDYQRYFELDGRRYCHLLDPRSAQPVMHTQALSVLISARPTPERSPTSPPSPCSLPARLAAPGAKLQVEQVLRVDAEGRLQVSRALHGRLVYVGGQPKALEVLP